MGGRGAGPGSAKARCAAAVLAALLLGCAEPAWDPARLEARYPALAGFEGHRLGDVRPYYLPLDGRLTLFLCRWPDGARIPVALPADATPAEREKLESALAAWERAGLPLRFERVERIGRVGIEIQIVEGMLAAAASAVAECAVDPLPRGTASPVLDARIVRASIRVARGDPRLAGTALHELGHALGFQGHAARGKTVMVTRTRAVRLAGERVARGEPFEDAAVGALYRVASGAVLARRAGVASGPVDQLAARAAEQGWVGPLLRVGDVDGRIAWLDAGGGVISLRLVGLAAALRDPARLRLEPDPRAARWLGGR